MMGKRVRSRACCSRVPGRVLKTTIFIVLFCSIPSRLFSQTKPLVLPADCKAVDGLTDLVAYHNVSDDAMFADLGYVTQRMPGLVAVANALGGVQDQGPNYPDKFKPGQGPFAGSDHYPSFSEFAEYNWIATLAIAYEFKAMAASGTFSRVLDAGKIESRIADGSQGDALRSASEHEYRRLMIASISPDGSTFDSYMKEPNVWAKRLQNLATCQSFEEEALGNPDPTGTRRNLDELLYKLHVLDAGAESAVRSAWEAEKFKGSILDLSARDQWPQNYFQLMRQKGFNPVSGPVSQVASGTTMHMEERTQLFIGRRGEYIPWKFCTNYPVNGEPLWRWLDAIMQGSGFYRDLRTSSDEPSGLNYPLGDKTKKSIYYGCHDEGTAPPGT